MSAAAVVAAGRNFLGGRFPGWDRFIDLDELDMADGRQCVLGQLARKDPRVQGEIAEANRVRREMLIQKGWEAQDIRPMPEDFFTACVTLGFDEKRRRAVDYGFDFDNGVNFAEVEAEWREVIEEEQGKWT